jgi:hypothetical protein
MCDDRKDFPQRLVQVRKRVQKKYPDLDIQKGNGYYYWFSDTDEKLGNKLSGCYTTSVYVNHVSHKSYDSWMEEADDIMGQVNNPDEYHRGRKMIIHRKVK